MRRATFIAALMSATYGAPASEGKHRCRDRDPMCTSWARGSECEKNHGFMADACPRACGYCKNAGVPPTPSDFQLDFVCNGQLVEARPMPFKSQNDPSMPEGCAFRCRDNMTMCSNALASGKCESHPEISRFQCPKTCRVCKALELSGGDYPKYACRFESGDDPEHSEKCPGWAESGEVSTVDRMDCVPGAQASGRGSEHHATQHDLQPLTSPISSVRSALPTLPS